MKLPHRCQMKVVARSWKQHLPQRERMTKTKKMFLFKLAVCRSTQNLWKNGSLFLWKGS